MAVPGAANHAAIKPIQPIRMCPIVLDRAQAPLVPNYRVIMAGQVWGGMVAPRVSSAPANPAAAPPTEAPLRLPSLAVHIVAVGTVRPGTKLARDAVGQRERIESQEQFRFALHLARAFHLCNRARHIAA